MKKGIIFVVCLGLILVSSLSFISAGFFDDIWEKITSKATDSSQTKEAKAINTTIEKFCGKSTHAYCADDSQCKAGGCSNQLCGNLPQYKAATTDCLWKDCYDAETYGMECSCIKNQCQWAKSDTDKSKPVQQGTTEAIHIKNRIKVNVQADECPQNCTCTGSVTKCRLTNGREMTIRAGKSGNTIVQVKEINMSTKVELYKSGEKVYGVFRNNQTKIIKVLPDGVKEKIRQRIRAKLEEHNITLDDDGIYRIQVKKKARLFFIFPVKERIAAEIDPETGEIIRIRNSWWGFLARDAEDNIVGGCGTVTPGMEDECCQNLGYNSWNSEELECE